MSLVKQGLCLSWLGAFVALAACESSLPLAVPPPAGAAILIVGASSTLNASEVGLHDRVAGLGFEVVVQDDDALAIPADCGVVLVSKTVFSETIRDRLKGVPCGVVFWEDNIQRLGMMSTIDNDGLQGTTWHTVRSQVVVDPAAPAELRAGLAGTIDFYTRADQVSFAPAGDLPPTAVAVALLGSPSNGRTAIYVYEAGAALADGTPAAGRRAFFGLYDDTFRLLTPAGLALFDAIVVWSAGS